MNDQTPPPSPTIGNCRFAHGLDQSVVGGAVEVAVAKRDPTGVCDRLLEMAHRGVGLAHRRHRGRVERIVLGLDQPALARVSVAGEALGDEAAHACFACGGEQRVRALDAKPVRLGEAAVEVLEVAQVGERGRLVDDRIGPGGGNRLADGRRVEQVENDRLRPERAQAFGSVGRTGGADHLVASKHELGDEPGADRAARPCDEDSHRVLLRDQGADGPTGCLVVTHSPAVCLCGHGLHGDGREDRRNRHTRAVATGTPSCAPALLEAVAAATREKRDRRVNWTRAVPVGAPAW
jgi:hypothetical protein